jgi:hypothetical protein
MTVKGIILTVGTASLVAAAGIPLAGPVLAAPAASVVTSAAPAQAPCLPVPVVGIACGALGIIPGGGH